MNLTARQLHLWYIPLHIEVPLSLAFATLSIDEQQRAESFKFKKNQRDYILRRFLLRKILSLYSMIEPQAIHFIYNEYQKPYLEKNEHHLQFNMSHSHDVAILGIMKNHTIGVDIECLKPMHDIVNIAQEFFSPKEIADFLLLSECDRLEFFYTTWTKKEAFVKAIGEGLSYQPNLVDVSMALEWSLNGFILKHKNDRYAIAIATKGESPKIFSFYYSELSSNSDPSSLNNSFS